jgi:streptogramin lyase
MRPFFVARLIVALLTSLVLPALSATIADAAEPSVYELPDATHASSLAVAPDGTVWFVPGRGTERRGESESIIGSISPAGVVTEHDVAGFGAITGLAISPAGEIWIAGDQGEYTARWRLEIGRVSTAGSLEAVYSVGRGGWIRSLRATEGAAWFVREPYAERGPSTVRRISLAGTVRRIPLHQRCTARGVAVGLDGSAWFTEMCATTRRTHSPRAAYVDKIEADGTITRRRLAAEERATSITVAADGTVWFGLYPTNPPGGYGYWKIGRIAATGDLAEYRLRDGSLYGPITAGPEGRVWFPSTFGGGYLRAINSIGVDGQIGTPICADPTCALEASDLTAAADGSLWYGLSRPNLNTGGGGSGLGIEEEILNEPGYVARLLP